jgi:hypothetical protein
VGQSIDCGDIETAFELVEAEYAARRSKWLVWLGEWRLARPAVNRQVQHAPIIKATGNPKHPSCARPEQSGSHAHRPRPSDEDGGWWYAASWADCPTNEHHWVAQAVDGRSPACVVPGWKWSSEPGMLLFVRRRVWVRCALVVNTSLVRSLEREFLTDDTH